MPRGEGTAAPGGGPACGLREGLPPRAHAPGRRAHLRRRCAAPRSRAGGAAGRGRRAAASAAQPWRPGHDLAPPLSARARALPAPGLHRETSAISRDQDAGDVDEARFRHRTRLRGRRSGAGDGRGGEKRGAERVVRLKSGGAGMGTRLSGGGRARRVRRGRRARPDAGPRLPRRWRTVPERELRSSRRLSADRAGATRPRGPSATQAALGAGTPSKA